MSKVIAVLCIALCGLLTFLGAQMWSAQVDARPVQAAQVQATNTEYLSPTVQPSATPVPSATVGYAATIAVAQSTADEARRVNAEVTAAHESFVLSQLQLTAAHEQQVLELARMTAQAAPTIYPMTQTQQAAINAQAATGQALIAGQLTATYQAPTQRAAIIAAEIDTEYLVWNRRVDLIAKASIALFAFAVSVFLISRWRVPEARPMPTETVIQMRQNNGGGTFQQTRLVVPCSPEQLTELAELAINGEKRFGINRIETRSRTFRNKRATLIAVREFLVVNELAIKVDDELTLNAAGEEFFAGWFENHKLPDKYEIGETSPPPPPLHEHDTHAHYRQTPVGEADSHENPNRGGGATRTYESPYNDDGEFTPLSKSKPN